MPENTTFEWGVTTLAGARQEVLEHLESQFEAAAGYRKKWRRTKWAARTLGALPFFDRIRYNRLQHQVSIDQPPVFIIGHWRSGTTLLHNMLCDLTDAAYCTTYQNVFPNNLFAFYGIIRRIAQHYMPAKRPGDRVKMHLLLPQEEELALGNVIPHCFYYWMFFPREMLSIADRYLIIRDHPEGVKKRWKDNYLRFVKRCMLRNGGTQFISKNPPNTARVDVLLELFPNARFIFLHRDIYDTILSTKKFYKGILPAQQYQDVTDDELEAQIIRVYRRIHLKYLRDRSRIPEGNLVELRFEDLCRRPLHVATQALDQLGVDYSVDVASYQRYRENAHRVSSYDHPREFIDRVNAELGDFFGAFGYPVVALDADTSISKVVGKNYLY
jgi:hypothetical protein